MKIDYRWSVAKEGYLPILTSFFVCWLGTAFFGLSIVSIILFILFLIILYFFRDPDRIIPNEEGILSPADGKIISIEKSKDMFPDSENLPRIVYGGSVNQTNIKPIVSLENVDGILIGNASLDCEIFCDIVLTVGNL